MLTNRIFGNELKYLEEVLESGFRASSGASMMQRFEKALLPSLIYRMALHLLMALQICTPHLKYGVLVLETKLSSCL